MTRNLGTVVCLRFALVASIFMVSGFEETVAQERAMFRISATVEPKRHPNHKTRKPKYDLARGATFDWYFIAAKDAPTRITKNSNAVTFFKNFNIGGFNFLSHDYYFYYRSEKMDFLPGAEREGSEMAGGFSDTLFLSSYKKNELQIALKSGSEKNGRGTFSINTVGHDGSQEYYTGTFTIDLIGSKLNQYFTCANKFGGYWDCPLPGIWDRCEISNFTTSGEPRYAHCTVKPPKQRARADISMYYNEFGGASMVSPKSSEGGDIARRVDRKSSGWAVDLNSVLPDSSMSCEVACTMSVE